jgi:hypothetical protein
MAAEFLVIFLGVSLSFLAEDWRQAREDRRDEHAVLRELSADLRSDSVELATVLARVESWDAAALWLWRHLGDTATPSDSVMPRLRDLAYYDVYQAVSSAYVGLKDGGQMALIRDQALRRRLVGYYEVAQPYMRHFDDRSAANYEEFRQLISSHLSIAVPDSADSFWPIPAMRFSTSWEAFGADGRTRAVLENTGVDGGNWADRIVEVMETNQELRVAIDTALSDF